MKAEILFGFICFVNYTFGYYSSGSGSLLNLAKFPFQSRGGHFGLFSGRGHTGRKVGAMRNIGMVEPYIDTVMGGDGLIQINGQNVINIACNDNTPYQDDCQRPCYCQDSQIYCPNTYCNPDDEDFNFRNRCLGNGFIFENDCNTCFCFTIGLVCTANDCTRK